MSEWQDIKTAPKDGSWVRAAAESRWVSMAIARFPYQMRQRWNGEKWEADDGRTYDPQPTHWRPDPPIHPETGED